MAGTKTRWRMGVDVGGTHTDIVLLSAETGTIQIEKVSSTPDNPALGVLEGIRRFVDMGVDPAEIEFFAHGTTITTNALLEMRGTRVGMLITRGYRAIQEIQQQARDGNPFDYFFQRPPHLAPQSLTREIGGRFDYEGNELEPLDENAVREAAHYLRDRDVGSIAVIYLFSYMKPDHERRTRDLIFEEWPGAHVSLSSDVLPRIREWPRMSTTLLNAYLEPVLVRYISNLSDGLDEIGVKTKQRFLMQSNGGVMPFTAATAGAKTVHTLFSGPAAGARAAAYLSGDEGKKGLVTLDMGGTSCDIAFIENGVPLEVTESEVARRRLDVPALDLTTISAGGGSIAWIDGGGLLSVGPQSAGAVPGPVCYGKNGVEPTVTDADIACGFLNPDYFLGGAQMLDREASLKALEKRLGKSLGMTAIEAACGIRRIVDMRMADEVRVFGAKRGIDPQAFTLLPFGGAGAVHAAPVAEELNMNRILIPPRPGAFSALGLLCTDVVHDYVRSDLRPLDQVEAEHAEAVFAALEARGHAELDKEGMNPVYARFQREFDMRYTGQGYELRVPVENSTQGFDEAALAASRLRFDEIHARIHGHAASEKPVEIVSYRVRALVPVPKYVPARTRIRNVDMAPAAAARGTRQVWFTADNSTETEIWARQELSPGVFVKGPAIIEQLDATSVIPTGWIGRVDGFHNLVMTRDG